MASTSAVSMALPLPRAAAVTRRPTPTLSTDAFFKPLPVRPFRALSALKRAPGKFEVRASSSLKEKVVTGMTAAALTASMIVPDVAEAAVSPSLKNFLLSIAAGGVVLAAITGAVVAVANFDPVKRA